MAEQHVVRLVAQGDASGATRMANQVILEGRRMQGSLDKLQKRIRTFGPTFDRSSQQAVTGLKNMGKAANTARFHSANMFAQFQDIGVMMAAGQNPFILAAQQGSQLSQVFHALGNDMKTIGPALGQAFKSFISPVNLLTVGIIAAGAAGGQWLMNLAKTEDQLDDLDDVLKRVTDSTKSAQTALLQLRLGLDNPEQADLIQQIRAMDDEIRQAAAALKTMTGPAATATIEAKNLLDTLKAQREELLKQLDDNIEAIAKQEDYKRTVDETAEAERLLGEQLQEVLRVQALAANEAERMRDAAMDAAREFMTMQALRSRFAGEDVLMGMAVVTPGQGDPEPEKIKKKKGGTDPFQKEFEALQNHLMSEAELEQASYESRQLVLEQALDRRLLTQEQFQEMERELNQKHQAKMAEIDVWRHGSVLAQTEAFMGQMAGALQSGNDKMLRISKIFGAGEALVNAWRAYAQVIADPELPWFAKLPKAAAVLSAGLGAVQAIKGAQPGGSSAGGGAAAVAGGGGGTSQLVNITLNGSPNDTVSLSGVRELINQINEAVEGGARIRVS